MSTATLSPAAFLFACMLYPAQPMLYLAILVDRHTTALRGGYYWWVLYLQFTYYTSRQFIFIAYFGMSRTGTDQMHSGECLPVSGRENPYKAGYLLYLFFFDRVYRRLTPA
jgi:hypothetical protein